MCGELLDRSGGIAARRGREVVGDDEGLGAVESDEQAEQERPRGARALAEPRYRNRQQRNRRRDDR